MNRVCTILVQIVLFLTLLLSPSFAARIPNRRTGGEGLHSSLDTNRRSKRYTGGVLPETKRISLLTPYGPIHVSLLTKNAPKTTAALIKAAALRSDRCSKCQFYRAEARPKGRGSKGPPYGLLQGSFGKSIPLPTKKEGRRRIVAGDVVVIPPTGEFYIALLDHDEWSNAHTVVGMVDDFVSTDLIAVQVVKTVVHPEYGTEMKIMKSPVSFTLSDDMAEMVMPMYKEGNEMMMMGEEEEEEEEEDGSLAKASDDGLLEPGDDEEQEKDEDEVFGNEEEEADDDVFEPEDDEGLDEEQPEEDEEQQYGLFQQDDDIVDDEDIINNEDDVTAILNLDDEEDQEEAEEDEEEEEEDITTSFTRYEKPKRPSKKASHVKSTYRPSPISSKKAPSRTRGSGTGRRKSPPRKHRFADEEEEDEEQEDMPQRTAWHSKTRTHTRKNRLDDEEEDAFQDDDRNIISSFEDSLSKRRRNTNRRAVEEEEDVFEDQVALRDTSRKRHKPRASKFERVDIRELPSW
ncbi:hypothetical protein PSENEW3_00002671 [Picochlorum sp. SENEW3]|nr:hypothetical protein PSENEW3_00002671 [Picochlorum sp. SENEW3]